MKSIIPTIQLTNEFCSVLTDIERNGMKVNIAALDKLETQYRAKYEKLEVLLKSGLSYFMGDTPVNLGSPEQMSKVIFSRALISKQRWANQFGLVPNMPKATKAFRLTQVTKAGFVESVKTCTAPIYKTTARQCPTCGGTGRVYIPNKDGTMGKRPRICSSKLKEIMNYRFAEVCGGKGYRLIDTTVIGGLGCIPKVSDVSSSGFSTDADVLERCLKTAKGRARVFLENLIEYNGLQSKLDNLIPNIRKGMIGDILHTTFNQAVTATGRLSSKNPNVQNFPRGTTFPIKQVFISRWQGGRILESDYAGLEFVVAVALSGDKRGTEDILNREDKHSYTMRFLRNKGQNMTRQESKTHTFKPLYGGSSGTDAEQEYYKQFYVLHPEIKKWHGNLVEEVINTKKVTIPSGRFYSFPHVVRTARGCTSATQVKNYPVQGFATADIVPCAVVAVYNVLKAGGYKSLIINTVHDSIILDIHPDELDIVPQIVYDTMVGIGSDLKRRYDYDMKLPLRCELKWGVNWFDLNESKLNIKEK